MGLIDEIRLPIQTELHTFKRIFAESLKSDNPLLSSIHEYILEGSGKLLRPMLVLLAAKTCGSVSAETYNGAISMELLHNASLIHDDVVDDTYERRGRSSINARWTNKIAVLSGDYMLSNALISATRTNNLNVLKAVANIGMELSDGELLQLTNSQQSKITEEDYLKVVRKKTALLFSSCCEVGGLTAKASENELECLKNFGEYMGICFQIKDDVFDYYQDIEIGKPTANDLQDGKVTLPLIYAIQNSTNGKREEIMAIIDSKDFTRENVDLVMNFAIEKGGLEYASKRMEDFKTMAIQQLTSFPESEAKQALIKCAEFASARKI